MYHDEVETPNSTVHSVEIQEFFCHLKLELNSIKISSLVTTILAIFELREALNFQIWGVEKFFDFLTVCNMLSKVFFVSRDDVTGEAKRAKQAKLEIP